MMPRAGGWDDYDYSYDDAEESVDEQASQLDGSSKDQAAVMDSHKFTSLTHLQNAIFFDSGDPVAARIATLQQQCIAGNYTSGRSQSSKAPLPSRLSRLVALMAALLWALAALFQ